MKKLIFILMCSILFLLLICSYLVIQEMNQADEFCKSKNGTYGFVILKGAHICNGQEISKFKFRGEEFWAFESEMNQEIPTTIKLIYNERR